MLWMGGIDMMNNSFDEDVRLTGEDAVNFANSIFRPTKEHMEDCHSRWNNIENGVHLRRTSDGYEADIDDLDLSFLDDSPKMQRVSYDLRFELEISKPNSKEDKYNNMSHGKLSFVAA